MSTSAETPSFDTQQAAHDWMHDQVDDPCVDCVRFAFLDDPAAMERYDDIAEEGCCGSFDRKVVVGGREAMIGCNYGH